MRNLTLDSRLLNELGVLVVGSKLELAYRLGLVAANSNDPVLVLGETGTGKTVLAKFIHLSNGRRERSFVRCNCGTAAASEIFTAELLGHEKNAFTGASNTGRAGLLEMANGGTLLFDDVDQLPVGMQRVLLGLLDDGVFYRLGANKPTKVDVRFICTTNKDLRQLVKNGLFLEDLYFRLAGLKILMPPLRETPELIAFLAEKILAESSYQQAPFGPIVFGEGTVQALMSYEFPGNVRDLRNTIEQAVMSAIVHSDGGSENVVIYPQNLEPEFQPVTVDVPTDPTGSVIHLVRPSVNANIPISLPVACGVFIDANIKLDDVLLYMALEALRRTKGNKQQAAKLLHIFRPRLYSLLKRAHEMGLTAEVVNEESEQRLLVS